jgi:molybdopterin molybdotransferase
MDRPKINIALEEAQRLAIMAVPSLASEMVSVRQALWRVPMENVVSDIDYPTADVAAVDGYALDASVAEPASETAPVVLSVIGAVRAGQLPDFTLGTAECARIATGAVLPQGADAVIMLEDVDARGDRIRVLGPVRSGDLVRMAGEIVRKGQQILRKGERISPPIAGMLACCGVPSLEVSCKPRVGVFATGNEVVPYGIRPDQGKVTNSICQMIIAMLEDMGCETSDKGISNDSQPDIVEHIEACGACDAVVITGGTSAGEFDLVPAALDESGAGIVFRGLDLVPGRSTLLARRQDQPIWCLPGSPLSALVLLEMLVMPGLRAAMGFSEAIASPLKARWSGSGMDLPKVHTFVPAILAGDLTVTPVGSRGWGDVVALARANALVSFPDGISRVADEDIVDVYPLSAKRW